MKYNWEFLSWLSGYRTRLASMRTQVPSLASLTGLRIQHCCELWCRSKMRLGSGVAVALVLASGYSSDWTPQPGNLYMPQVQPYKAKKKKKKKCSVIDLWWYANFSCTHNSIIQIYILFHFLFIMAYYRILNIVPCSIQQDLEYLFYIQQFVPANPRLLIYPSLLSPLEIISLFSMSANLFLFLKSSFVSYFRLNI